VQSVCKNISAVAEISFNDIKSMQFSKALRSSS